jgi:cold shock CspA family protein
MAHGVLKWFNQASDYGFIACDDGSPDRYVRGENVTRGASIAAGSRVQFEPREGGMGPEATNVRKRAATRHPVQNWESEGGAIAELHRANRTAQAA